MALLYASALPDAMVVPVLRGLMVDRYGVSVGNAHAFMTVNLIGALIAATFVGRIRQRLGLVRSVTAAAAMNALLLAIMALPIGFFPTLVLRCIEGGTDLMVYALLFAFVGQAGSARTRGRRLGAAATVLMLGIASGVGIGGVAGATDAVLCLWLGAVACLAVTVAAPRLGGSVQSAPVFDTADADGSHVEPSSGPLWPALVMMFSDRAVAGLLATTVPLYLSSIAAFTAPMIGVTIGAGMLMTALGAWPAGFVAERLGVMRLRVGAGIGYALTLAALPLLVAAPIWALAGNMVLLGCCGAALFASSLLIVSQSGRGTAGMGAYHAAGNLGFLLGPLTAAVILTALGGPEPPASAYTVVLVGFATLHVMSTLITMALAGRNPHAASVAALSREAVAAGGTTG